MGWYVLVTGDARAKGHFFVVQKRKLVLQSSIESFSRMNLKNRVWVNGVRGCVYSAFYTRLMGCHFPKTPAPKNLNPTLLHPVRTHSCIPKQAICR